jgi:Protein of unknown function (DUF3024)
MAFNDFESDINRKALDQFLERIRPPERIREQLDFSYKITGQTIDILEIRPDWKDKTKIRDKPVARIKYVRTDEQWHLYWMRGNLKWLSYEPDHLHSTLQSALKTVEADSLSCFFG